MRRMRHPVNRLFIVALPCVFAAGSLTGDLATQLCRHWAAPHAMQHGAPADGPCWCDDMTGAGITLRPVIGTLPPAAAALEAAIPFGAAPATPPIPCPESPSFAPTPPPPNGRFS